MSLRRVRTLRLAAPGEDLARRGAILVEDALRTASLPAVDGGRLLLVRTLPLGRVQGHAAAGRLALAIEEKVEQINASAVHAMHPAATRHPAVYFSDQGEAIAALAVRLARGEDTGAWFWPLAVPAWQPGLDRDEALRRLLAAAARPPLGLAGALAFLDELREQDALDALLAALRPQDGPALLRTWGWQRPGPVALSPGRAPALPAAWHAVLDRWVPRWTPNDDRSTWLTATALAAGRPVRLLDARLMVWAAQAAWGSAEEWENGGTGAEERRGRGEQQSGEERESGPAVEPDRRGEVATPTTPQGGAGRRRRTGETKSGGTGAEERESRGERQNEAEWERGGVGEPEPRGEVAPGPGGVVPDLPGLSPTAPQGGAGTGRRRRTKEGETGRTGAEERKGAPLGPGRLGRLRPVAQEGERSGAPATAGSAHRPWDRGGPAARHFGAGRRSEAISDRETRQVASPRAAPQPPAGEPWSDGSRATAYAGLYFVVPILERLGIATWLASEPELIELDLPARLLRYTARRLRIPPDDPVLTTFAGTKSGNRRAEERPFISPIAWRARLGIGGPWLACRVAGRPGTRVLCDGEGRLALALWHGRPPEALRAGWPEADAGPQGGPSQDSMPQDAGPQPLRRGPLLPRRSDMEFLLGTWYAAMRLWLQQYANLGLRELVQRPGRIAATRTHVDVLLDLEQADVRIRRAGLDIDPGWVPWLGHVVLYHYLYPLAG